MNAHDEIPAPPPFWAVLFLTTLLVLGFAGLLLIGRSGMCDLRDDTLRYCDQDVR